MHCWNFLKSFLKNLSKIFENFSKTFENLQIFVFRPNARKLNALFLKNFEKYPQIIHVCNFLKTFFKKFVTNFRKFPNLFVFSPNALKLNAWLVKIFEKYAKIIHNVKKFSKVVRRPGGSAPRTPYEADPLKMSPPEPKSCRRQCQLIGNGNTQYVSVVQWFRILRNGKIVYKLVYPGLCLPG